MNWNTPSILPPTSTPLLVLLADGSVKMARAGRLPDHGSILHFWVDTDCAWRADIPKSTVVGWALRPTAEEIARLIGLPVSSPVAMAA